MAKRRILLITFEGLANTVIDSQVLLHARLMREAGVADFEIWAFCWSRAQLHQSFQRQAMAAQRSSATVRVFMGVKPGIPGSRFLNARLIRRAFERIWPKVQVVHARTNYTAACCSVAGLPIPYIWDCRGDSLAEQEAVLQRRSALVRKIRLITAHAELRAAAAGCAGAIFVSRTLADIVQPMLCNKNVEIIPCGASHRLFFFDPILRRRARVALGFEDDTEVYIYSGGLAVYQCFDETLTLFAARHRRNPKAHLLVLTPAVEEAVSRIKSSGIPAHAVTLRQVQIERVNEYLNAADCAFMLREDSPINASAAPTKFAEYVLAGLPVIMNSAVRDYALLARKHGNMIVPQNDGAWELPKIERSSLAASYIENLSREAQVEAYLRIYAGIWDTASE